jgi:hypothetical protein
VLRFVAVALVVIIASVSAIDGVCCPDGCTDEAATEQHESNIPDVGCLLCAGGIELPVAVVVLVASHHTPASFPIANRVLNVPASPPDHPPRS